MPLPTKPIKFTVHHHGAKRAAPFVQEDTGKRSQAISQVALQEIISGCLNGLRLDLCDEAVEIDPATIAVPHNQGEDPEEKPDSGWLSGNLQYPNTNPQPL